MKTISGRVAAITGAASGIGRATAVLFAREGCHLALADVDGAGLAETADACRTSGVRVTTSVVDVADRAAVHAWADAVVRELGAVHVVVNNAGVALGATVEDTSYDDFEWLMGVDFWGVVHGTKAFLPHLRAAGEGHVVNVSSVFGLIGVPTQSAYNAAKFAVRGFTESLAQELAIEGAPIGVTCVHPGGIATNIARRARRTNRTGWVDDDAMREFEEQALRTPPERAARDILDAVLRGRRRQLVGWDAVLLDAMQRWLPVAYQDLVAFAARRRISTAPSGSKA